MGRQGERDGARLPKPRPRLPRPDGERRQDSELRVGADPGAACAAKPRAAKGPRAAVGPPPNGPPAAPLVELGVELRPMSRGVAGGKERPRCSQREFWARRASLLG